MMKWLLGGVVAASLTALSLSPALATTCGSAPGVTIDVTGVSVIGSCNSGSGSIVIPAAFSVPLPLTWSFTDVIFPGDANIIRTDGIFSFSAPTGYANFLLGFQLDMNAPHPDWFTFVLPATAASGTFDSDFFFNISIFHHTFTLESFSDKIKDVVLYASCLETGCPVINPNGPGETPLPAALPLFAGGLGVIGLLARRRKNKAAALAV